MEAETAATVVAEAEASRAKAPVVTVAAAPESAPELAAKPRPIYKVPQRGKAGGRPHRAILRLTTDERTTLEARATAAGLSVASYLRTAALGTSEPRARRRPTIDRKP